FQTFDDNKQRRKQHRGGDPFGRTLPGRLSDLTTQINSLTKQGAGIYVTVNEVRNGEPRTNDNVSRVRAVFVDLDGAPIQPVRDWTLSPHIIVESSPGKFHAYWITHDTPLDQFTTLQKKLATLFKGDPAVCDLARVLRLPGGLHQKVSLEG